MSGGGGGSSRPDATAGSCPAGAPSGTPATTELLSLAQYLALEQFPMGGGDNKHSRAAELRRALGLEATTSTRAEATTSTRTPRSCPFALLTAEELRRIRGGVAESSARAKDRVKSLQESIQKLDKYKNVVTRRRWRSEGAPGAAEPPSLAQYLALEQFPAGGGGDHKHSRAAELRRALGVAAADSAEQPLSLLAAKELRLIRGGVAESLARAKERAKSLQESIQKLDKCKNVLTGRRRQRSKGVSDPSPGEGVQQEDANPTGRPSRPRRTAPPNSRYVGENWAQ